MHMSSLGSAAADSVPPGTPEFRAAADGPSPEPTESTNVHFAADQSSLRDLIDQLMQIIPADGMAIALSDGAQFLCRASAGWAPKVGTAIEPGMGLCGECISQRRIVRDQQLEGELGSLIAIPISNGSKVRGCIAAFSFRQLAFRELDIEQLVAIAYHLANQKRGTITAPAVSGSNLGRFVELINRGEIAIEEKPARIGPYSEILKIELAAPLHEIVNGEPTIDEVHFRSFEQEETRMIPIGVVLVLLALVLTMLAIYKR